MKTYTTAGKELLARIGLILRRWHPKLADAGVTVSALLCAGGLKHHGYPAHAVVKINSLKDRVEGKADCTITFDDDGYDDWPESQQAAVIDHELEHLELVTWVDGNGMTKPKRDDCGRPVLRMRPHDVEIGGFASIIDRHKEAAVEAQAIAAAQKYVQGLFAY